MAAVATAPPKTPRDGDPAWLPLVAVAGWFAATGLVLLIVLFLTGELFGNGLPATAHGMIEGASVHEPGLTRPLSETQCRVLFEHVFALSSSGSTDEVRHTLDSQRASLVKDMVPKCQATFTRQMFDCVMASSSQDALSKCDMSSSHVKPPKIDDHL